MRIRALLLLLLLAPVGAQDGSTPDDRRAALAPIQTVIDALPIVVEQGIAEARLDGTADDAQRIADDLLRFVAGLRDQPVPAGSAAARHGLQQHIPWAIDVAHVMVSLPGMVGSVQIALADCSHEGTITDQAGARETRDGGLAALRGVASLQAVLDDLVRRAPDSLDLRPFDRAVRASQAFLDDDGVAALACLASLEDKFALDRATQQDFLEAHITPRVMWPTGNVTVSGTTSLVGELQLEAHGLFAVTRPVDRSFSVPVTVAETAPLGVHNVTIRLGSLERVASLDVIEAPATMDLLGPARIRVDEALRIDVRIASPVPVAGMVTWDDGTTTAIVDGRGVREIQLERPGVLALSATHPGHRYQEPSQDSLTIEVLAAAAPSTSDASNLAPTRPPIPWATIGLSLLGLFVALAFLAVLMFFWRQVRQYGFRVGLRRFLRPQIVAGPVPVEGPPPVLLPRRGFLATVAAFMGWLRTIGRASPGTTVREAAAMDVEMQGAVEPFELIRYGQGKSTDAAEERAPGLFSRIVARLRGEP